MKRIRNFFQQDNTMFLAMILRIGLGSVFVAGGTSKLSQLLNPDLQQGMVDSYMGSAGYVNAFFTEFIFSSNIIEPWHFLTMLSTFEFLAGIALIIGFAVLPLSLIFGFLFWTFVVSLPVVTTPGVVLEAGMKTYLSPALLVLIRDIALSGMCFVLYNLGAGNMSVDKKIGWKWKQENINWDNLGLLLRLSLGIVFIVGGMFAGFDHIATFGFSSYILLPLGIWLISGIKSKQAGYALMILILWYIFTKLNLDKSIIANFNGIKREMAILAGAYVLSQQGGGKSFVITNTLKKFTI
ncbi:hypothetical protein COB57_05335 [Candidatus Peregrinibacteria bacterium]|nr:MAG: hypothetical protein COB57_05335 [Candidatus Peregrinibacteria bacterium]